MPDIHCWEQEKICAAEALKGEEDTNRKNKGSGTDQEKFMGEKTTVRWR